jgi:hypothetical protein
MRNGLNIVRNVVFLAILMVSPVATPRPSAEIIHCPDWCDSPCNALSPDMCQLFDPCATSCEEYCDEVCNEFVGFSGFMGGCSDEEACNDDICMCGEDR